jgi:peptidoglycan/LPS O-acetylase OafA/YrhL
MRLAGFERADGMRTFRPDIAGLRAVAVALVVLDHAQAPGFTGGFTGVDVFYVISGFLITGMLLRELDEHGRIRFGAFYARRARRLLPAATLVTVVTLVWSMAVLGPMRLMDVVGDAKASALYYINYRLAENATNYFGTTAPSPYQHYWSLAVEEQYYVIWPLLLFVVWWAVRRRGRISLVVAAAAIASLAFSIHLTTTLQPWAFFSLPTRGWELAVGGLLALAEAHLRRVPGAAAVAAGIVGLVLLLVAAFRIHGDSSYPSWYALIPVTGAALIIGAGVRAPVTGAGALLKLRPMQWLGAVSYSLYLWHWPLMILPAAMVGHALSGSQRAGLVLAAVVLAELTRRLVEDPVRHARGLARRPAFGLGLAALLTLVAGTAAFAANRHATSELGVAARTTNPSSTATKNETSEVLQFAGSKKAETGPQPVPADLHPSISQAKKDLPLIYRDGCQINQFAAAIKHCVFGNPHGSFTIVLFGDSHAAQWFPALDKIANADGDRLVVQTHSHCPAPIVNIFASGHVMDACTTWRQSALRYIATLKPDIVLVATHRPSGNFYQVTDANGNIVSNPQQLLTMWQAGYDQLMKRLQASSKAVALFADSFMAQDIPYCVASHLSDTRPCDTPRNIAIDPTYAAMEQSIASQDHVGLIDTTKWTCPGDPCPAIIGNVLVWRDQHHLTSVMTTALSGLLRTQILKLAGRPVPARSATALADVVRATSAIPVPNNLKPSLRGATANVPVTYHDGCHLRINQVNPPTCVFGRPSGKVRIALIGDSHAAQWFPALDRIARRHGWRFVSLTHSRCAAPFINVFGNGWFQTCNRWRVNAVRRIKREHPDIVVVTSHWRAQVADSSGHLITDGTRRLQLWRAGYDKLIGQLRARARHVVLLTDSEMGVNVPVCLRKHLSDARACFTPRTRSVDPGNVAREKAIAAADRATLITTTQWSCPSDPCPAFIGHTLLWRDTDHLTARFTASLAPRLYPLLLAVLRR